ncbi:hypothetical protein Pcinc_044022 [Petrolisthes cinctipes]|uniref:Uncharacterized protein n=1 Tax=Petrolisthes cinctipes TaxID=88211 RepID=A0AAE1EFM9_PETCI|nr:hypothetical protein Pcinc_044022 [Petrolisthes cinctipes]
MEGDRQTRRPWNERDEKTMEGERDLTIMEGDRRDDHGRTQTTRPWKETTRRPWKEPSVTVRRPPPISETFLFYPQHCSFPPAVTIALWCPSYLFGLPVFTSSSR